MKKSIVCEKIRRGEPVMVAKMNFFNADGVCKIKLKDETKKFFKTIYVDVTCEEGSAYSVSVGNPKGGRSAYTALDN